MQDSEQPARKAAKVTGAGYLCFQSDPGGEWAALLVVSPTGLPIEFVYSGPLRPTPVQSILYQDRLAEEVRLSLARSLQRGLRSRPAFYALASRDLEAALEEALAPPVLLSLPEEGEPAWVGAPPAAAQAMRRELEDRVGVREPLGRARAALAYVADYERTRTEPG